MSNARNLSKFKPSSSGLVETADIADDAVTTAKVDPAQTDITSLGTLSGLTTSGAIDVQGNEIILDADNDTSITADTDDQIDLKVGGTDTLVVKSDVVEIKGSHPDLKLMDTDDNNYGGLFYNNGSMTLATDHDATGATGIIKFAIDGNEDVRIDSGGDLTINDGNLVIGTSGHGIDFSAQTGGTALSSGDGTENPTTENEVLKHYEHGTFKPKVVSSGATFDYQGSGGQYGSGHYTRIGDIVFIDINLDSDGGISGTTSNGVQIQNLPFTGHTGTSMNIQYFYRRVSSSSYPHIMAQQYDNYISFLQSPDSGQWRDLPASEINFSDHRMKISGCYHIGTV